MRVLLPQLNFLIETYKSAVKFVFVYIMEAHAIDEWPNPGVNNIVAQHTTLVDRLAAAQLMRSSFQFHHDLEFVLDNINNDYNRVLPSWPFRFYVVKRGKFQLKMMPEGEDEDETSLDQLHGWLEDNVAIR